MTKFNTLARRFMASVAIMALAMPVMTSCSDDEDNDTTVKVSVNNVFKGKRLDSFVVQENYKLSNMYYEYSNVNQLAAIRTASTDYNAMSSLFYKDNTVRYTNSPNWDDITIGANGFISDIISYDNGTNTNKRYSLKYDENKCLKSYDSGESEYAYISWENGDIQSVYTSAGERIDVSYTNKANRGMMLYDTMFGVKMGNVEHLFFGGMLGMYTKHLPSEVRKRNIDGSIESSLFEWETDGAGYPTKMTIRNTSNNSTDVVYSIYWR